MVSDISQIFFSNFFKQAVFYKNNLSEIPLSACNMYTTLFWLTYYYKFPISK